MNYCGESTTPTGQVGGKSKKTRKPKAVKEMVVKNSKGSKGSKGSKHSKGSKGSKHSKHSKHSKGSKGSKGSKNSKQLKGGRTMSPVMKSNNDTVKKTWDIIKAAKINVVSKNVMSFIAVCRAKAKKEANDDKDYKEVNKIIIKMIEDMDSSKLEKAIENAKPTKK
jgi:hypothetical protein